MAIDIKTASHTANITGGLSGPAIKPIALRMVWEVAQDVPIVGMGGIMDGTDAVEFLLAGATGIGVGTANLVDPTACVDILDELKDYMIENKIEDIRDLIGALRI